ncbi:MAG: hypothetical protein SFU98_01215 [Leptospiraceae bacterium]|nr:hypothetical protein [Leptospiraceae bacterium]
MEFLKKLFLLLFFINCASTINHKEIHSNVTEIYDTILVLQKEGKKQEAYNFLLILKKIYPNDSNLLELEKSFSDEDKEYVEQNWFLGVNQPKRARLKTSILKRILFYIPDRISDILDLFDIWIDLGPQLGVEAKVTSVVQLELFSGAYTGVGFGQNKMIGGKVEKRASFAVGPIGVTNHSGTTVGSSGIKVAEDYFFIHSPGKNLYQTDQDYWAFGGKVGAGLVGVEIKFHPFEFLDLIAGIFFLDLSNDDLSRTRALNYNVTQRYLPSKLLSNTKYMNSNELKSFLQEYPSVVVESE